MVPRSSILLAGLGIWLLASAPTVLRDSPDIRLPGVVVGLVDDPQALRFIEKRRIANQGTTPNSAVRRLDHAVVAVVVVFARNFVRL